VLGDTLGSTHTGFRMNASAQTFLNSGGGVTTQTQAALNATNWYLVVITRPAGSNAARIHIHDGTSWSHAAGTGNSFDGAIDVADIIRVGASTASTPSTFLSADVVCTGIKRANSSDATVITLSPTAWASWLAFGFDWLIGFDSSFVSGGLLQDQGTPGTGDETSRSGTSLVSDPAGWSFATSTTWNGSSTVSLTDTVTTAGTRLGVTIHGATTTTATVTITTASHATTLYASTTVTETVTVTTRAALQRMILVPRAPGSLVLVPRPPDSLVLTPR